MTQLQSAQRTCCEFPCTPVQERFFVAELLAPGNAGLNIALRWSLVGPVSGTIVGLALRQLVARHEILRTAFVEGENGPVQRVYPTADLHVPELDLRLLGTVEREFDRISAEEARRPFDLSRAPLMRAQLLRFSEQESFLLITAHHIVADGWSMGILAREFATLCDGLIGGTPAALPELPVQYSDYALWQQALSDFGEGAAADAYWRARLAGFRRFEIATDFPRPPALTRDSAITSILMRPALTAAADRVARASGATWFTTMLTGLLLVLRARAGRDDVIVGTQVAGRYEVELENVVGPFINTLALRTDFAGVQNFAEALARVADTLQGALENGTTALETIIEIVKPERDPSRHPLFSINVIQQRAFDEVRCENLLLRGVPSQSAGALFDLNFFFVERTEGWRFSCEYNTALYRPETVVAMLEDTLSLLTGVLDDPRRPIPQLAARAAAAEAVAAPSSVARPVDQADDVVRRLLPLWRATLGAGSDEAGFLDAGGHSLSAFRLIARIQQTFEVRLEIDRFLGNPTVRALADVIRKATAPRDALASVVALQPHGAATPIIAFDNPFLFQDLAKRIGADRPFLCVMPAAHINGDPALSFAAVAAHYVEGIRRAQPQGPYILLGHCFGSHLAYEAAQQLVRDRADVACVIAVDGWAPGHLARRTRREAFLINTSYRLIRWQMALAKLLRGQLPLTRLLEKLRLRLGRPNPSAVPDAELERVLWLKDRLSQHPIAPYSGTILVVRALGEPTGLFLDPTLGWRELATGRLEIRDAPGNHFTIFEGESVQHVAAAVRQTLARLEDAGAPEPATA
ncbi:hypothetical protein GOFOIKOB_2957 [Methylobacterium tardum]|nr:condensation domain-containing protein [Methylobacterium tardum]GJE49916.1 hypothetical protein GOFOIKOB_2957 [Methylobacterium tardum]